MIQALCDKRLLERPIHGGLYADREFKISAVASLGLDRAFETCREELEVPGLDRLVRRRMVGLQDVASKAGEFRSLWRGGQPFTIDAPEVIGPGDQVAQTGRGRSAFVTCLSDVVVRGRSAVMIVGDSAVVDYEQHELNAFAVRPEIDPMVLKAEPEFLWTMEAARPRVIHEAFLLSGIVSHDFGHWLTDHLPKIAFALMGKIPEMPILIDECIPATHRQSVELFFPDREVLTIGQFESCKVRRLWCAPGLVYRWFYPTDWEEAWSHMLPEPKVFGQVMEVLKSSIASWLSSESGSARIYLARKPDRKKRLVNQREIENVVSRYGFKVIYPEELSFPDQVKTAHGASHIIAPDGSNGLLSYFASSGAKVCFLNNSNTKPLVELRGLLDAVGAEFTIVTGAEKGVRQEEPFWNDYEIDGGRFETFLQQWLSEGTGEPAEVSPRAVQAQSKGVPTVSVNNMGTISALETAKLQGFETHQVVFPDDCRLEVSHLNHVLYFPSALDTGQSLQMDEGGNLIFEAVFDEFTAQFVRRQLMDKKVFELGAFPDSEFEGPVCVLGNVFSRNFTHWHEELMKVAVIERAGIDCVYVVSELPSFSMDLLSIMGIPGHRILEVSKPTRFRSAIFSTPVSYRNVSDYSPVLMDLRQGLLKGAGQAPDGLGSRLWLERGEQTRLGRKLVNEEEVYRLVERFGFERIDMAAWSVPHQIAIAEQMQLVGGLHGSQFVHTQLMAESSAVLECFSPLYLNPTYTEIYRVLNHRYFQLSSTNTPVFPYPYGKDVHVDIQQLELALRTMDER